MTRGLNFILGHYPVTTFTIITIIDIFTHYPPNDYSTMVCVPKRRIFRNLFRPKIGRTYDAHHARENRQVQDARRLRLMPGSTILSPRPPNDTDKCSKGPSRDPLLPV
jgi:hypothetical protein